MTRGRPKGSKNNSKNKNNPVSTPIPSPSNLNKSNKFWFYASNPEENIKDYLEQNLYILNPSKEQIQELL